MSLLPAVLDLFLGLAGLLIGGELLVRGAVRLAHRLRLSPMVIGLTVVAFGTSSPELVVCILAARDYAGRGRDWRNLFIDADRVRTTGHSR